MALKSELNAQAFLNFVRDSGAFPDHVFQELQPLNELDFQQYFAEYVQAFAERICRGGEDSPLHHYTEDFEKAHRINNALHGLSGPHRLALLMRLSRFITPATLSRAGILELTESPEAENEQDDG